MTASPLSAGASRAGTAAADGSMAPPLLEVLQEQRAYVTRRRHAVTRHSRHAAMDKCRVCADNGRSPSAKREQAIVSDLRQHVLSVGTPVEVRSRFVDRWVPGFVILAADDSG